MSEHAANASALHCTVVTPEATVVDGEATFVALPLFDGELGVAYDHSPMIGRLGYGEMRVRTSAGTHHYYVDGGFVQVADNRVTVLTNRALPSAEVDGTAAQELLSAALSRKAAGDDEIAIRHRALSQARAQVRIARRAK